MNARYWLLVCMIGLVGCGDDDAVADTGIDAGPDTGIEAGPDTGIDAGPDTGVEAGTGACDGPYQHPLYVAPFQGTCLGPERAVPGSCVTGMEGMTGNGEIWCFTSPEGVLHASFIQYGEDSLPINVGEFGGDQDAGDPNEGCALAVSRLDFLEPPDGGVFTSLRQAIPHCDSQ